jgi:hypothetical protein
MQNEKLKFSYVIEEDRKYRYKDTKNSQQFQGNKPNYMSHP